MFTGQKRKGIDMEIAPFIVVVYAFFTGLFIGWTIPRGRAMKRLQVRIRRFFRN